MNRTTVAALFGAVLLLTATDASSQDIPQWPRWRGPLATGVSPSGSPPIEWSEEKNIRWKVAIPGKGSASPIIWGDKLFLLTAAEAGQSNASNAEKLSTTPVSFLQPAQESGNTQDRSQTDRPRRGRGFGGFGPRGRGGFGGGAAPMAEYEFIILCLDRNTGKTLWKQVARREVPHEGTHNTNTFASASPVTDGKHVYASFGSRGIYCYTVDGKKVWEADLGNMSTKNAFGEGASPALHGDTLIVPWDHEGEDFVVALDAKTGDEKWRTPRDEPTTWGTPLVAPRGDGWQVVLNGRNRARSYHLKTGKLLWECGGQTENPIPTPVADGDNVYVMTGFRGFALYAIPLNASGDLTDSDRVAWKRNQGTPYISSPVLSNGLLYFTQDRNAILSCVEAATGKDVYTNKRLPGIGTLYASPVAASGRLYFFSREGAGVVVKEGRNFEILAENRLDETIDASPAIIGNVMYVRGERSLYCIAEN